MFVIGEDVPREWTHIWYEPDVWELHAIIQNGLHLRSECSPEKVAERIEAWSSVFFQ